MEAHVLEPIGPHQQHHGGGHNQPGQGPAAAAEFQGHQGDGPGEHRPHHRGLGPGQQQKQANRQGRQRQSQRPTQGFGQRQHRPQQHREMETGGRQGVGEAGDAKVIPQLAGQGHHGTAQNQGRQQPALVGTGLAQKGGGDAAAQVGDGGGGTPQHADLLDPQLAPDPLAPQPLPGAGQQRVGGWSWPRQGSCDLHLPAFLQGRAAGEDQLAGATIAVQQHPAARGCLVLGPIAGLDLALVLLGARLCWLLEGNRIRPQPSLQSHRRGLVPSRQPAHRILWPGLGLTDRGSPHHQGRQQQGHHQGQAGQPDAPLPRAPLAC